MTATDELRRLLDERGVKYYDMQNRGIWFGISEDGKDHKYEAFEQTDGLIEIDAFDLTPEQAIVATLGTPEIVRCRDCKYCKQREAILPPMVCERWGYHNFKTEPGRFCSWAERREQ